MNLEEKIIEAIEPALENKGYGLARVKMVPGKRMVLAIDIDKLDDSGVTIEDCVEANRLISAMLDVENFIEGTYNLEVSSPGASRPLSKIRDFERFCGKTAKMELLDIVNGKRKFSGEIISVDKSSETVRIRPDGEGDLEVDVPLVNIKKASVSRGF